jgi:hypothetical protein
MFGFKKHIKAQNLVYNGYFEIYSNCPTARSTPSNLQLDYATGWLTSASTPDYYNTCASISSQVNVPYSIYGYQQDCCGGIGYAGEFMLDINFANSGDREYIYTKLIDTLKAGHKYLASMYVSKADGWNYAVATIGMLFTDTAIVLPYPQSFINATPQIKNTTLLTDTLNWILIQDTVTAVGNETYVTIGNFNTSATCDSVNIGGNGNYSNFAYYYIDGVSVYDVATLGIEQVVGNNGQVIVYPNPNNGSMMLDYTIKDDARLEMTDITGNLVGIYNLPATGTNLQIQNNNLQSGMYLYRVISNNIIIKQGKIVVMK